MKPAYFLSVVLLMFSLDASASGKLCEPLLNYLHLQQTYPKAAKRIFSLPTAFSAPLPSEAKTIIRNHRIYDLLARFRNEELALEYDFDVGSMGKGLSANLELVNNLGESIQASFLAKILDYATDRSRLYGIKVRKLKFRAHVLDTAEIMHDGGSKKFSQKIYLMRDLKAANPGPSQSYSKEEIRSLLEIPKDAVVVSVYGEHPFSLFQSDESYGNSEENAVAARASELKSIQKIFDTVGLSSKKVVVFESAGGNASGPHNLELDRLRLLKYPRLFAEDRRRVVFNTFLLSGFGKLSLQFFDNALVQNDTTGYMPYLYRASDLAIVIGPINFFEPLNAGTPTIALIDDASLGRTSHNRKDASEGYDRETYYQMVRQAQRSGSFSTANELDAGLIQKMISMPAPNPSYLVPDTDGKTPLESVLDQLYFDLEKL